MQNRTVDMHRVDKLGRNCFWVACNYGHGQVMHLLSEGGIDIYNESPGGLNALHVAVKRDY